MRVLVLQAALLCAFLLFLSTPQASAGALQSGHWRGVASCGLMHKVAEHNQHRRGTMVFRSQRAKDVRGRHITEVPEFRTRRGHASRRHGGGYRQMNRPRYSSGRQYRQYRGYQARARQYGQYRGYRARSGYYGQGAGYRQDRAYRTGRHMARGEFHRPSRHYRAHGRTFAPRHYGYRSRYAAPRYGYARRHPVYFHSARRAVSRYVAAPYHAFRRDYRYDGFAELRGGHYGAGYPRFAHDGYRADCDCGPRLGAGFGSGYGGRHHGFAGGRASLEGGYYTRGGYYVEADRAPYTLRSGMFGHGHGFWGGGGHSYGRGGHYRDRW